MITLLLLVRATHIWCCSSRTFHWWWNTHSAQCQWNGCNNIHSLLQRTTTIACSFCEACILHDLHILVIAPFCCDWKARAASVQSFTLWQQAKTEFTWHDHSIACSRHIYIVLFYAHIPFVVNREFSATPVEWLQQHFGRVFKAKECPRKNVKFRVTRHWLELTNQWLEMTLQFLWLDSPTTRRSHDSDLTRKNFRWLWLDSDSKGLWL